MVPGCDGEDRATVSRRASAIFRSCAGTGQEWLEVRKQLKRMMWEWVRIIASAKPVMLSRQPILRFPNLTRD
jgi:hypothetical protein